MVGIKIINLNIIYKYKMQRIMNKLVSSSKLRIGSKFYNQSNIPKLTRADQIIKYCIHIACVLLVPFSFVGYSRKFHKSYTGNPHINNTLYNIHY